MTGVLDSTEAAPGVLLLRLNRPDQRNALDPALIDALEEALAGFAGDERWRAAVLTGSGPGFCAGLDLKAFSAPDAPREKAGELIRSVARTGKPIIAAVNGSAYTGGLELALACDFILAAQGARFADTHAKIGALSGSGMTSRLPRAVGARFARQMILTCLPIDALTALRVGLVNEVLPAEALLPRAIELASAIAAHDPGIIRIAKGVIDQGTATTLDEAIRLEAEALARRKAEGAMAWSNPRNG